ncbi:MAG: hypothetical protein BHW08_00580 [Clostridium sp. CAG:12237_41]|nr:MAG: hypothetical protein BHW08_00580 [Clostridium sp. CAG:12237_41]
MRLEYKTPNLTVWCKKMLNSIFRKEGNTSLLVWCKKMLNSIFHKLRNTSLEIWCKRMFKQHFPQTEKY